MTPESKPTAVEEIDSLTSQVICDYVRNRDYRGLCFYIGAMAYRIGSITELAAREEAHEALGRAFSAAAVMLEDGIGAAPLPLLEQRFVIVRLGMGTPDYWGVGKSWVDPTMDSERDEAVLTFPTADAAHSRLMHIRNEQRVGLGAATEVWPITKMREYGNFKTATE